MTRHTLGPPYLPQLHEFYSREIHFDPWHLRSEPEGIAALVSLTDSSLHLHPLAHDALIRRLFALADIRAMPSQPGRIAQRILANMGGLDACRVFKIGGVRDLLQGLRTDEPIERGEATKRIWKEGDLKRHEELYIEQRERGTHLNATAVFDFLLKKDLFRAGLELLCDQCGLRSWRTLRDLDDAWRCEYCGATGKTSLQLTHRGEWKFRKSGLFAKDNNQEGALPVVLALMSFLSVSDFSDFCFSTALNLHATGLTCETDLCVVQREQGLREFALAIGECKAAGGTISADDVGKMRAARDRLVAAGIPAYLVFAKAAPAFSSEELVRFREISTRGIPLILLTNRELEPYHPYWEDETEHLPAKYAHSLEDMAHNSIARYLAPLAASAPGGSTAAGAGSGGGPGSSAT